MSTGYLGKGKLNGKHVIDHADGAHLLCCWDDCEKTGTTLHRARIYEGTDPRTHQRLYSWKIFCTERHKLYYINAPRDLYNLPAGHRLSVT